MIAYTPSRVRPISADLVAALTDPAANIIVGRFTGVRSVAALEKGVNYQVGMLSIVVIETLSGRALLPGAVIEVPFQQIADPLIRGKSGLDQWNRINLKEGGLLLLACTSVTGNRPGWRAVAAQNLGSLNDPAASTIRQALSIERLTDASEKQSQLTLTLQSPNITLFSYGLRALGERNVLGQPTSLRTIVSALNSASTPSLNKREIGHTLTDRFSTAPIPNQPEQILILGALASALVNESTGEGRAFWGLSLRSCLLGRAASTPSLRNALIQGVRTPSPEQVTHALAALAHDSEALPDLGDRATMSELVQLWQIATRP